MIWDAFKTVKKMSTFFNSLTVDYACWEFEKKQLMNSRGYLMEEGNDLEAEELLKRINAEEEK